ncbi:uncharacterized protein LOC108097705 [Drosophila ficusphila]|uniref:uncharacterized protein LOC108097705 n=1 Tax=Drosophila ficusphila TaxID=30025 RepID=UPI0007E8919B|nr:uncharacterized protein LOC108097705 [Drosophila ficusphila]
MVGKSLLLLASVLLLALGGDAHQELENLLLKQQADLQLSIDEVAALRPLFREFQAQFDYLYSVKLQSGDGSDKSSAEEPQLDSNYLQVFEDFRSSFAIYLDEKPRVVYDTQLPTVEEIMGQPSPDLNPDQRAEFEDLRDIIQDVIDEAQLGIDDLVARAVQLETNLLKLNKPKIVTAAIVGLGYMWNYWGRGSQAAYCSYSQVPEFQIALQSINDGVDCYSRTMALILRIQNETVAAVKEIKSNVGSLVKIYKKIVAKQTTVGKILSGTINALSAIRRVHDIIAVGIDVYGKINNQLPGEAIQSAQCGVIFVNSIPQMLETVQNLTTCITYVNPEKPDYEFTHPEEDRYWNTGAEPPEIPHENEVDEDDDDEDYAELDDYEDHR